MAQTNTEGSKSFLILQFRESLVITYKLFHQCMCSLINKKYHRCAAAGRWLERSSVMVLQKDSLAHTFFLSCDLTGKQINQMEISMVQQLGVVKRCIEKKRQKVKQV